MNSREQEYKAIFIAEALEIYDHLSTLIIDLERTPGDDKILAEIFRLLHNLKANAKAMGYDDISNISHKLETAFGLIRGKEISFTGNIVTILFDGVDLLNDLIQNLDNPGFPGPPVELLRNLDLITDQSPEFNTELLSVNRVYRNQNLALSDLIYIRIKKLDDLMNLVGELIIDKDRITAIEKEIGNEELRSVVSHLHRITNALQNSVMDARLVSIGSLFNKFPRIIRDVALVENKKVDYTIKGNEIQVDRNILQIVTDSLLHIVRNAVAHGIENSEERQKNGKTPEGKLFLTAQNDKDTVLVTVEDDGKGIDPEVVKRHAVRKGLVSEERLMDLSELEIFSFIFEPGFSLSEKVTQNAGRGVGLDVVKNAMDIIGGKIEVESKKGKGTKFSLTIPTSMAVKGALLFRVQSNSYAIPLIHTLYVATVPLEDIHQVGNALVLDVKTETLPLIYLKEYFESDQNFGGAKYMLSSDKFDVIIVSYNNRKLGLIVDQFLRQQDIVVKPLHEPVDHIDLYSGVTLLGNGEVCLVLDIPSITRNYLNKSTFISA